jgi:hypothetical protein
MPSWSELREMILAHHEQIKETTEQIKETGRKMEETDRMIKETSVQMKENERLRKESEERLQQYFKETEIKMQKQIDENNKLYGGFTNEFGKIIEDLCKPAALKMFKTEVPGIDHIYEGPRHMRKDEEEIEVDVLLCNSTAAVAVEVKTTCYKKDIDHFLCQMKNFKKMCREFADKTLYVAIAAMRYANDSDKYAKRKGLYVLTPLSNGLFSMEKPANRKEF